MTTNPFDDATWADWTSVHERLESVIAALSTCHVDDDFIFEHGAARIALEYVRKRRDGELPPWTNEQEMHPGDAFLIAFLQRHGQSLDWVFYGEIRSVIAMCASMRPRASRRLPYQPCLT